MAKSYKFAEHYLKGGTAPLDKITLGLLERIQQKYTLDYLSFLRTLEKEFPEGEVKKGLHSIEKKIQKVIRLLGTMRGVRGVRATRKEIEQLFALMEEVDEDLRSLQDLAEQMTEVREAVIQAQNETSTTLEELALIQEQIHLTFKETRATHHGEIWEAASGVGRGILWKAIYGLGGSGFAGIVGAGTRMYNIAKATREKKAGHFLSEILTSTSRMRPEAEEDRPFGESLGKGGPISWQPSKAKEDLRYAAAPIWYFFHYQAGKAKWTKEVLRLLKQRVEISGEGDSKSSIGSKALKTMGTLTIWEGIKKFFSKLGGIKTIGAGAVGGAVAKGGALLGGIKTIGAGAVGGAAMLGEAALGSLSVAAGTLIALIGMSTYKTISDTKTQLDKAKKNSTNLWRESGRLRNLALDTQQKAMEQRTLGNAKLADELDRIANKGFEQSYEAGKHIFDPRKILSDPSSLGPSFVPQLNLDQLRKIENYLEKIEANINKIAPSSSNNSKMQPISMQMREPYDSGDILLQSYISGKLATA